MQTLALGADIKNRFLFTKDSKVHNGPDLGDLSDAGNYESFKKEVLSLSRKIKAAPEVIACDLHPGYFSTRFANSRQKWFKKDHKVITVQHHWAHIASVMHEHGLKSPVIGVSFDGTGYGTDGNIWGGEFIIAGMKKFERAAHLKYIPMPGGEKAIYEPWRMVLSILGEKGASLIKNVDKKDKDLVLAMISKKINAPLTSSAGRLFDAAAALLGICTYASYEAEGPIKLEAICEEGIEESYNFDILNEGAFETIDSKGLFAGIVRDMKKSEAHSIIATKFHNSISAIIVKTVKRISRVRGIKRVALSGGVFQNNFLKKLAIKELEKAGMKVYTNIKVPASDLNIALGQYYVSGSTGKN